MNIYVTTASNAEESSWGTYCPGYSPSPPPDYDTCLGDLYSVGWMEDSEAHNTVKETLQDQYIVVKERTSNHHTYSMGSHVMQYGDTKLSAEALSVFMGFDPANANATFQDAFPKSFKSKHIEAVDQRDADLLYLWQRVGNRISERNNSLQSTLQIPPCVIDGLPVVEMCYMTPCLT
eukprot:TRINITY_DN3089_c0_g1_i7.p1 TRINITY_DN3089_c0_g1~~TRINITY_DN3089_c0_g1_i7.p1  ORF type:complete len:177 (+),score=18.04 TRINITY_DN3089_c0_g1_i7:212-742(+)